MACIKINVAADPAGVRASRLKAWWPRHLAMIAALLSFSAPQAAAQSNVQTFTPQPQSEARYDMQAPEQDPARQRHVLKASDGIDIFVESWLPVARTGGDSPPDNMPTILQMTPYAALGPGAAPTDARHFVERGYAYALGHVRGTGQSGGCIEITNPQQIDDTARVIEYLGRDAPWASGVVGMYGLSYDAETQLSVAAMGDPARIHYLKAIIPASTVAGQYEYNHADGVPYTLSQALVVAFYGALEQVPDADGLSSAGSVPRIDCQLEPVLQSTLRSSNVPSPWFAGTPRLFPLR